MHGDDARELDNARFPRGVANLRRARPAHARHRGNVDHRAEARIRAIGYRVGHYKIVAVMLSGLFAGLAGVLYAIQNEFAAPDFVYFITSGDTVIFNMMGGTLVGPIAGAGFFQLIRELLSRWFGDQFPYLIPLSVIFIVMIIFFIVMIIFLPQGLLGFARRWLNR